MAHRRDTSMRRLQDNYAKLEPKDQRNLGYKTITKAGVNKPATAAIAKPKPGKADDSAAIEDRLRTEEAEGLDRGRGYGGLAGLKTAIRADTDKGRAKNKAMR